jgi:hypothetical protein
MKHVVILASLVLAGALQAQGNPTPIKATSPFAKRVDAVARLVLGGDHARIAAYVKRNAADTLAKRPDLDKYIDELITATKTGDRVIARYDSFSPIGVAAALAAAKDKTPTRAIFIRTEDKAPYRIKAIRLLKIGNGPVGN